MNGSQLSPLPPDFPGCLLGRVPLALTIPLSHECRLLQECRPFGRPLLLVGCGPGCLAEFALDPPPEAGTDRDLPALREAARRGNVHLPVLCRGWRLPFREAAFETVMVLNSSGRVPDPAESLPDFARVIRPGGRLLLGVAEPRFSSDLAGHRLLAGCGLNLAARAYGRWISRLSGHSRLLDLDGWIRQLRSHGFVVEQHQAYGSSRAHGVFDLLGLLGGFSSASAKRRLSGRLFFRSFWLRILRSRAEEPFPHAGAFHFLVSRRLDPLPGDVH